MALLTEWWHQVLDRAAYYLSSPVSVNVRVSRNDSLPFPVLTLCNKNAFNVTAMRRLKASHGVGLGAGGGGVDRVDHLVGVGGRDARALWDALTNDWNVMMREVRTILSSRIGTGLEPNEHIFMEKQNTFI